MGTAFYLTTDPERATAAIGNHAAVELAGCGYVYTKPDYPRALYGCTDPVTDARFYTICIDELDDAIHRRGYRSAEILGYAYAVADAFGGNRAVYRGYHSATNDYLYTLEMGEILFTYGAYEYQGIAFYISASAQPALRLYRLRSPMGTHVYVSTMTALTDYLAQSYVPEGDMGGLLSSSWGLDPLYESVSLSTGERLYTTDLTEHCQAIAQPSVFGCGAACYLHKAKTVPGGDVAIYRYYSALTKHYIYTTTPQDMKNEPVKDHYKSDGIIGWSGSASVSLATPEQPTPLRRFQADFRADNLVPAPVVGDIGSNYNYLINSAFCGDQEPIKSLAVYIDITEDLICESNTYKDKNGNVVSGFSFQLNAASVENPTTGFQQYVISIQNGILFGVTCNFLVLGDNNYPLLQYDQLALLPDSNLAKGWLLGIELITDANHAVTGAQFSAVDPSQNYHTVTRMIDTIKASQIIKPAPIGGFEIDLVGHSGGDQVTLSKGRGYYWILSSQGLKPDARYTAGLLGGGTAEAANSRYALMQDFRDSGFVQDFWVPAKPKPPKPKPPKPMHRFEAGLIGAKGRHTLPSHEDWQKRNE